MTTSRFKRIIGGLPVGPDGNIHTTYRHDPSTFRLSAAAPNLTNIPRGSTTLGKLVRGFFVAPAGYCFQASDFAGIEAVLVGFFANAPRIIRIFKLDGHSYFTAWVLYELDKTIKYEDLPQESWSDSDLRECLSGFKKRFKERRETNKKMTHGANYLETAPMAQVIMLNELGVLWPVKDIQRVMDFYHNLFPEIGKWHMTLASEVGGAPAKVEAQRWGYEARNTFVRQPFGLVHRYYDVVKWTKTPGGWDWSYGEDMKRLASFLPQSSARFLLTRAAQRIWENPATQDVAETFRLFIHDELMSLCKIDHAPRVQEVVEREMRQAVPELVMPDGSMLAIGVESKRGPCWGEMKGC